MIKKYNEGYQYVSQNKTIKIKDTDYVIGELIDGMQERLKGSEFDVDDYTQHEEGERYYDGWEDSYNNKVAKGCSELTFMILDYDGEIPSSDLADAIKETVNCFDRAESCQVKVERDPEAQSMIREYGKAGGRGWRAYVSIKWKADTKKLLKKAKEDFAKWLEEEGRYYLSYYEDESEKLDAATELLEKWATDWYYDNFDRKAFRDMADLDGAIKAGTSKSLLAQALEYVESQMAKNESKIIRMRLIQEKTSRGRRFVESWSKNSICGEREYKKVLAGLGDNEQLTFMAHKLHRIGFQNKNRNYDREYSFKEYLQWRDPTNFGKYPEFDWTEFYNQYEASHWGPSPENPYVTHSMEAWDSYVWDYLRKKAFARTQESLKQDSKQIYEMVNNEFTTPKILKRCEDTGLIDSIKRHRFDDCAELADFMQSMLPDLAEELPLSCFLNAAAALFYNGVAHFNEGAISGTMNRLERKAIKKYFEPCDQAAWIWARLKDSNILKGSTKVIANRWLDRHPEIDIKKDLDFDPHPIDTDEIDFVWDPELDCACLRCVTGQRGINSTRIGYSLNVPVDFAFKVLLFNTEAGEKIIKKIDKDYADACEKAGDLPSKTEYMKEILRLISQKAQNEVDAERAKRQKVADKEIARIQKANAKARKIADIKSEYDFEM